MGKYQGNIGGQKVEEKTDHGNKEVMLKVYIHCEGCSKKLFNCLQGFDGVEEIVIENANQKVMVKGKNMDPIKILRRLEKKYSRNVELISPKPQSQNEEKKEDQKKEEPKTKTIVLKTLMHCEGCALDIKRSIRRIEGVMSVDPDMSKSTVIVRGLFDPAQLVQKITKRLGKHVMIVKQKGKGKDKKDEKKKKEMLIYPSQNNMEYLSLIFNDENVFSCSIM